MYARRIFYFDVHPPLGKLILAAAGYVAGFDGQFNFDRIGAGIFSIISPNQS
jgi:dolichyl-phosphate-mannose-protein mannosyltransferase